MNIIVGKNSGFCAGVKYTISKTEEELSKTSGKVDCLGEIIHNKQVVNSLEQKGLRIINSIDEAENKVIIRAHGISRDVYEKAKANNIKWEIHITDILNTIAGFKVMYNNKYGIKIKLNIDNNRH